MKSVLNIHWEDWCWSWSSNTLAIWCKELTHWKRPWCWERLKARGEGDDRGWDGWMASLTWWTWAWASSRSWLWTGKPGVLQSMGSKRVGHDWATEMNWYCNHNFYMHWEIKKINMTCFIAIFLLLWQFGTESATFLMHALCSVVFNSFRPHGL